MYWVNINYKSVFVIRNVMVCLLLGSLLFLKDHHVHAQDNGAQLGVFDEYQVSPGGLLQVPITINNVSNLYAVDFILDFDEQYLQVVDANLNAGGVQASLGGFLDPGLLLFNEADNSKGMYRFAMSQVLPSLPKSGNGIVIVITFKGLAEGESKLNIDYLMCANQEGEEVPCKAVDSKLKVMLNAPTQAATYLMLDSTGIIPVQTFTPIPTSTPVPPATITPRPSDTAVNQPVSASLTPSSAAEKPTNAFWLVRNWWIIIVLMSVALVLLVVYLVQTKKSKREGDGK